MTYHEKGTWAYLVTSAAGYVAYLVIILGRVGPVPVSAVSYVAPLLWTAGASMIAATVLRTAIETWAPSDSRRRDVRDRDIDRFGEYTSRWLVTAGAAAGMLMAMARWNHFWIANVLYLGFVLSAVCGSTVKLVAYRRGL